MMSAADLRGHAWMFKWIEMGNQLDNDEAETFGLPTGPRRRQLRWRLSSTSLSSAML